MLDLHAGEGSADMERLWQLLQRAHVLIESAEPGAPDHARSHLRRRRASTTPVWCTAPSPRTAVCPATPAGHPTMRWWRRGTGLQWEKRGWPGGSIERVNRVGPSIPGPGATEEMAGPPPIRA